MAVAGVALLAFSCVAIAWFATVLRVRVDGVTRLTQSGLDRHGAALVVLAVAGLAGTLAALATRRGPLVLVVLAVGVALLVVALGSDLPDFGKDGFYGAGYDPGRTSAGPGFYLELVGAAGFLVVGALGPAALRSSA